jgi:serine/threonine-protein kinase HipA
MDDEAVATPPARGSGRPGLGNDLEAGAGDDPLRISIAGAQEKTALLRMDGQWCRPLGATPTTHILKLPLGLVGGRRLDLSESVYNEWLCAQLLRELGLPVATTDIGHFDDQTVLVVERFDRQWQDVMPQRWIARIPQEDFCQVLGLPSEDKYEAQGGPGMASACRCCGAAPRLRPTSGTSCVRNWPSGCWRPPTATPRTSRSSCCPAGGTG